MVLPATAKSCGLLLSRQAAWGVKLGVTFALFGSDSKVLQAFNLRAGTAIEEFGSKSFFPLHARPVTII
jgi:hypothetical protein